MSTTARSAGWPRPARVQAELAARPVALVSQNVHLFNDTVANNIAYARTEEYSREQIEEAARMAYAMDFINKMDNGLDTIIGENGVMLSGGQRQPARCCVTARS